LEKPEPASKPFTNAVERSSGRRNCFYYSTVPWHPKIHQKASPPMSVKSRIIAAITQIAEEQKVKLPPLDDNLSLHETGFDSLAFAILVARLEDDLGIDP
jgi:acyl carrier protein